VDGATDRLFRVLGRVQGVGFRWWTRAQAERLGVAGTVRNCPDGSVEVRAHAREDALAELHRLLRQGPPGAYVERVDAHPIHDPPAEGFRILR
jgi:acylphosphatase